MHCMLQNCKVAKKLSRFLGGSSSAAALAPGAVCWLPGQTQRFVFNSNCDLKISRLIQYLFSFLGIQFFLIYMFELYQSCNDRNSIWYLKNCQYNIYISYWISVSLEELLVISLQHSGMWVFQHTWLNHLCDMHL